jgi:hypothetical protein
MTFSTFLLCEVAPGELHICKCVFKILLIDIICPLVQAGKDPLYEIFKSFFSADSI